jgi:hypothetical protein
MNRRFFSGLVLLLFAAALIYFWPRPQEIVTLTGIGGGSKRGLLADPDVVRILREKYHIAVKYSTCGSLECRPCNTCDFFWPGNEADVESYQAAHPGVSFERIFQSPQVFYSWDEVTDVLLKAGVVQQEGGVYYMHDVAGFLEMNRQGKTWREIGLTPVHGRVGIIAADPTAADSGNGFAAYMAGILLDGQVPDQASIEDTLPAIKAYFARLGFMQKKTSDLWSQYVTRGIGAYPMIVAYESLGIELIQNDPHKAALLQRIRIVYPQPTLWYSHPLIFTSTQGRLLGAALKDPEIQKYAWERHGFRSAVPGIINDPARIEFPGVAQRIISVMPLPRPEVLDRITQYLQP